MSDKPQTEDGSSQVSIDFVETCWAFLTPRAKDFVVKSKHFLRESSELADMAEVLTKSEQLFASIYLKNDAIRQLIERERRKKTDELLEKRQLSKIKRVPSIHVCRGAGCRVCGGS